MEYERITHLDVFEVLGVTQVLVGNDRVGSRSSRKCGILSAEHTWKSVLPRMKMHSLLVLYEILGTFIDVCSVGGTGRQLERVAGSVKATRTRL
jgi:hypothetical protein